MQSLRSLTGCLLVFLVAACASPEPQVEVKPEAPEVDTACSYFYFLWGNHSEYFGQYADALEAYEKALICDPEVQAARDKLPVLMLRMGELDKAAAWLQEAVTTWPEKTSYQTLLANIHLQRNEPNKALALYQEILRLDPENSGVELRLGLLYLHQEEYDRAEQIFKKLISKDDDAYFAQLSLARLYRRTGTAEQAMTHYERALELNWSPDLAYELGHYYATRRQFRDALRIYTTITDNTPDDERAQLSRVQAMLDLGQFDRALDELEKIRELSQNRQRIDIIRSKIYLRRDQVDQARKILEAVAKEGGESEPLYMLALLAYQDEDFNQSLEYLEKIDYQQEEFEEAIYLRTRILKRQGNVPQAISLLQQQIISEESRSPLFYAVLASLFQEQGDQQRAIETMEAAVIFYPENHQLLFEYGLLLEKTGSHEQALETMEQVLKMEPEHADALNFVGYTWADRGQRLEEALAYIEKAIQLKPDNGYIMDSLGWVHFRLGNLELAAKYLQRALELEAKDPHIHEHLGDVYLAQNKQEEAKAAYQTAYDLFEEKKKRDGVREKIKALESAK